MIRPSFDIGTVNNKDENLNLLLEVGERFLTYLTFSADKKQLLSVRQYHIDLSPDKPVADSLFGIFAQDEELQQFNFPATIIYNFPESNLVPESSFDMDLIKPITSLVYGDSNKGLVLSEKIDNWDLYNVYRIPRSVHSMVQKHFTTGRYWHYYSLLLKCNKPESLAADQAFLTFYPDRFVVVLFRDEKLLLINTILYQTPEDVAYYLLAICQQHLLDPKTILLRISGLIDEQSALYSELKKYFLEINREIIPAEIETSGILDESPAHYFSHLLKMALCV